MIRYVTKRLVMMVPLLLGISLLAFLLVNLAPGDPVTMLVNPADGGVSAQDLQARRIALGLNDPLPVRYVKWLGQVLQGNLGYSYATGRAVVTELGGRLGATLQLTVAALIVAVLIGVTAGVLAATRQYSWLDHSVTLLGFFSISVPSFFLGLGLIYLLSLKVGIFPTSGMNTLGSTGLGDRLHHLILPAFVLSLPHIAEVMRYTRGSLLGILRQDFIRTARGKGLSGRVIIWGHALRNALLPIITIVGLTIPQLLGGALITESIFQWPGMGTLSIDAVNQRDYPIVLGVTLFSALVVLLVNLATDLAYAAADPRIRYKP